MWPDNSTILHLVAQGMEPKEARMKEWRKLSGGLRAGPVERAPPSFLDPLTLRLRDWHPDKNPDKIEAADVKP